MTSKKAMQSNTVAMGTRRVADTALRQLKVLIGCTILFVAQLMPVAAETPCMSLADDALPAAATAFELKVFGQQTLYEGAAEEQYRVCVQHRGLPSRTSGINIVSGDVNACHLAGKISGTENEEVRDISCMVIGGTKIDAQAYCSSIDNVHGGYFMRSADTLKADWSQVGMMTGTGVLEYIVANSPEGHAYKVCNPGLDVGPRQQVRVLTKSTLEEEWGSAIELAPDSCQDFSSRFVAVDAGNVDIKNHPGDNKTARFCFKRIE